MWFEAIRITSRSADASLPDANSHTAILARVVSRIVCARTQTRKAQHVHSSFGSSCLLVSPSPAPRAAAHTLRLPKPPRPNAGGSPLRRRARDGARPRQYGDYESLIPYQARGDESAVSSSTTDASGVWFAHGPLGGHGADLGDESLLSRPSCFPISFPTMRTSTSRRSFIQDSPVYMFEETCFRAPPTKASSTRVVPHDALGGSSAVLGPLAVTSPEQRVPSRTSIQRSGILSAPSRPLNRSRTGGRSRSRTTSILPPHAPSRYPTDLQTCFIPSPVCWPKVSGFCALSLLSPSTDSTRRSRIVLECRTNDTPAARAPLTYCRYRHCKAH